MAAQRGQISFKRHHGHPAVELPNTRSRHLKRNASRYIRRIVKRNIMDPDFEPPVRATKGWSS